MNWARRTAAQIADALDEFTTTHNGGSGRDHNERGARRDARRQARDEITMGEHEPETWLERGWADHAQHRGWTE